MANKILQIDLQNDITPQIGSYDNTGGVTPNNWQNEGYVYSLGPTNTDGTTPYYWFTPTKEVTDFDLCWEDYQDHSQTSPQYHLEIGDSAGNVVLSALRANQNYSIGPVGVGNLAYQTWHKMLVEVRKASASSSTVTAYVDGKKIDTGTSATLITSAKIALLGHVPDSYYWQNAGQRVRYVTIYDRSYSSKGVNLDGIMTTITGFVNKLKGALSTVAFSGSYNDLSDKPTISTVNNGTLTIQQNGTNVQTFTANASTNKTANIQCVDLSTAQTISGVKTFTSNMVIQGGKKVTCNLDNSFIELDGGTTWGKGGSIVLSGQDRSSYTNSVLIVSKSDTNTDILQYQNGELKPHQNNTNNSSLGTSTNKWSKVYSDDIVHTTGNETIGGIKTFSNDIRISKTSPFCNVFSSGYIKGQAPTSNIYSGVRFFDDINSGSTNTITGGFEIEYNRDGYNKSYIASRNYAGETHKFFTVGLRVPNDDTRSVDFLPSVNNIVNLGSPTNKWAKVCSDDVVHTTNNETISGVKIFSDGLFASKSGEGDLVTLEDSSINSTNEDANGMPLTGHTNAIKIKGSQVNVIPCMLTGKLHTNGNTEAGLYAYKYKDLTANASLSLRYNYNGNYGIVTFDNINSIIPGTTNTTNLGASALQWNKVYTRNILIDNDISIANSLINKTSNSGMLSIRSGLTNQDGASIALYSKDYSGGSSYVGNIYMTAYDNSDYTIFRIYPNGTMSVYNNSAATTKVVAMQEDVVPRSGGAVMTDYFLGRSVDTGSLMISGGTSWSSGGSLETFGSGHSSNAGQVRLQPALSNSNFKTMNLEPSGTWTWSGTACQITSDQRFKQQISNIDDKLLDAWEDVDLVQFKYNDAVEEKSDNARLHTGYVVQQIDDACKSHGVDVSKYGLYCYEEYAEETREVEHEDGTKTTEVVRPASEHYSLRYTEALIVECAYLRKCIKELRTEIEQLKSSK